MLSSNINGVANGFPLCIEVETVVEKKVEFKAGFLRNIFPKVKWKAFVDAARTMGYPELPEEADSSLLDSDKFLTKFHHGLLELRLEEGALICLQTCRRIRSIKVFPICSFVRTRSEI
ncbi:hypothetical protein I3843_07G176500 [Carya illinoinensis]|uniref:Uncharacterized protein n=1 Tax=Carya illinoinensis TaxID=32201 RepID=A0A8T1Q692_CARIL|nr:hypothetical protein CIPAW_07G180000 [Carya illinoinensis]KAG7972317.1 hypothetical protein I3843_07G176500 [Carya illinoinensis]